MDMSIITKDWPYDEHEEANNVRKIMGVDGAMKMQVRLRNGVVQWSVEGRPDGREPYGYETMLEFAREALALEMSDVISPEDLLDPNIVEELMEELYDYCKRCRALFLFGDYRRALEDVSHGLAILDFVRERVSDPQIVFEYDNYRPSLLANRAQTEMLVHLRADRPREALHALNEGIDEIEDFYIEYELDQELEDCSERQVLIDLRRSLREKHNVPLTDRELLHSLKVEQQIAIRSENYEMAARLRDKINVLEQKIGSAQ
jgi:tetratricopeptide (TPR) repeat protein